jgi:DNA-binding Lrp family transcriptional regulator
VRELDDQERAIARALIKDPRISDNRLGEEYGIPVRTVSRKRARLESEGLLRYFAELDMSERGTGRFRCRHLYTIKFGVGVTLRDLKRRVLNEPNVMTAFTRSVYTSHIAEIDGRVALVLIVDGESDADIVERVQEEIIPALKAKHGDNAVEGVETVRLLQPIRMLRNYLPGLNMEGGKMRRDWSVDAIFVE